VDAIRSLIVASMSHWDHGAGYLAEAEGLMSLDVDDLERDEAFVVAVGAELAAFGRVSVSGRVAEIEELHVLPRWIGQGFGRALFEHAVQSASQRGAVRLRWTTEQNAVGFYERMGGRTIGSEASGIVGEDPLTVMELALPRNPA
jgi:GNAT superfamily N-acetyltransferase